MSDRNPQKNSGKGKEVSKEPIQDGVSSSIAQRIQESAAGLFRDGFGSSSASTSALSTTANNASKGSSSGTSSSLADSEAQQLRSHSSDGAFSGESFRSHVDKLSSHATNSQQDLDQFVGAQVDLSDPSSSIGSFMLPEERMQAKWAQEVEELDNMPQRVQPSAAQVYQMKKALQAASSDIWFPNWLDEYQKYIISYYGLPEEERKAGKPEGFNHQEAFEQPIDGSQIERQPSPNNEDAFFDPGVQDEVSKFWHNRYKAVSSGQIAPLFDAQGNVRVDENTEEGRQQKEKLVWLATKNRMEFESMRKVEASYAEKLDWERIWDAKKGQEELRRVQEAALSSKDGAGVVELLSDLNFQPGVAFEEVMSPELHKDLQEEPFELSPAELKMIEKLRPLLMSEQAVQEQKEQQQQQQPAVVNPLDFFPDQLSPPPSSFGPITAKSTPITVMNSEGRLMEPISGLEDWFTIINHYQDEVWGYLKPYAEAAKEEAQKAEASGEPNPTGGPAVRRLGMILAHLDERFNARLRPG